MTLTNQSIRVITICPFTHNNRVLVMSGFDSKKETYYYRPLGGGVEFGESTADALRREIREELKQEIDGLQLITVLENIFTVDGRAGHEIVYLYDAQFVDPAVYAMPSIMGEEDDGTPFEARWMALDSFNKKHRLVPGALLDILIDD